MAVSFAKNQDEITRAWRDVTEAKEDQRWALYGYEGSTNNIKLMSTGSNGLAGLVKELNCSLIQYAFCRVIDKPRAINKLVLINWQGDSSPLSRKGLCASHLGDVTNYFKGCAQTITIRNDDEATQEYLMDQIVKSSSSRVGFSARQLSSEDNNPTSAIGSTYKKTDISSEIPTDRKSFWQRQEEEEKERQLEERKRAAEKQAQFERERKLREESEARKLAEAVRERDRIIEATRQADRQSAPGSQSSSLISSSSANQDNDDERVGRRSELIRLERNQETQSLISKGLIKNKRAIFEQAAQQNQQPAPSLSRRSSGTMVSQRLNTFKSLDSTGSMNSSNSSSSNIEKITNGFATNVVIGGDEGHRVTAVKSEIQTFKLTKDQADEVVSSTTVDSTKEQVSQNEPKVEQVPATPESEVSSGTPVPVENTSADQNGKSISSNGNFNQSPTKGPKSNIRPANDDMEHIGKFGIRAKALYDYQATDNTEISFDPDDIIGFIDKVDPGWWQGSVITGKFKGQTGLFPANYVEELTQHDK